MARLPRLDLPGVPQHIVQRGNNRLPCFLDDDDRLRNAEMLAWVGDYDPAISTMHRFGWASLAWRRR